MASLTNGNNMHMSNKYYLWSYTWSHLNDCVWLMSNSCNFPSLSLYYLYCPSEMQSALEYLSNINKLPSPARAESSFNLWSSETWNLCFTCSLVIVIIKHSVVYCISLAATILFDQNFFYTNNLSTSLVFNKWYLTTLFLKQYDFSTTIFFTMFN